MPSTTAAETASRSASGKAISAFLPPSSSVTDLSVSEAAFITARPVGTLPMSATLATSGWLPAPPVPARRAARHEPPHPGGRDAVDHRGGPRGGWRRLRGRFAQGGVAGGGGGCLFPRHEHERVIERNDAPDHAEGLAYREIHRVRPHWDRGALHLGDEAGVEIELRGSHLCVAHHLGVGVAAIGGVDHGKLIAVLAQHV